MAVWRDISADERGCLLHKYPVVHLHAMMGAPRAGRQVHELRMLVRRHLRHDVHLALWVHHQRLAVVLVPTVDKVIYRSG